MTNPKAVVGMNTRDITLTIFPPRDAEEAKTRGLFESPSGLVYAHYNGVTPIDGESTFGLVHCYTALSEKLTELLMAEVKAYRADVAKAKTKAQKEAIPLPHITVRADANLSVIPWQSNGKSGNNVEWKVYGFGYNGTYYTSKNHMLVERADTRSTGEVNEAPARQAKASFFD